MLYKADTVLQQRASARTAKQHIARVARALGAGSTQRAMLAFAQEHPGEFWTKLYAKTIERGGDINVQINTGPQEWTIGDKKVEF